MMITIDPLLGIMADGGTENDINIIDKITVATDSQTANVSLVTVFVRGMFVVLLCLLEDVDAGCTLHLSSKLASHK